MSNTANLVQLWLVPAGANLPLPNIEDFTKKNQIETIKTTVRNVAPCPTVIVTGPSEPFIPNKSQTQTFTANVNDARNYQIEYKWTINGGEIIKGQGTSSINVFQPSKLAGGNVTATVEINGNFPSYCGTNSASETAIPWDPPNVIQIDGFSGSLSEVKNENLDNFARQLKENPTSQGNIIWYYKRNLSKNIVEQAIQKVTEYLTKEQKIDKARITIQTLLFERRFRSILYRSRRSSHRQLLKTHKTFHNLVILNFA